MRNFVIGGEDKRTPAMRLGLARGPVRYEDKSEASGLEEKLWLRELIDHLEDYAAMNRTRDNMVLVVSLGCNAMRDDCDRTWIDVVEQDRSYFHPVGNLWPMQPPNYIAFRYRGQLQSVHRIEAFDIVNDVSTVNPTGCSTDVDHFVYKLGTAQATQASAGGRSRRFHQAQRARLVHDRHAPVGAVRAARSSAARNPAQDKGG